MKTYVWIDVFVTGVPNDSGTGIIPPVEVRHLKRIEVNGATSYHIGEAVQQAVAEAENKAEKPDA